MKLNEAKYRVNEIYELNDSYLMDVIGLYDQVPFKNNPKGINAIKSVHHSNLTFRNHLDDLVDWFSIDMDEYESDIESLDKNKNLMRKLLSSCAFLPAGVVTSLFYPLVGVGVFTLGVSGILSFTKDFQDFSKLVDSENVSYLVRHSIKAEKYKERFSDGNFFMKCNIKDYLASNISLKNELDQTYLSKETKSLTYFSNRLINFGDYLDPVIYSISENTKLDVDENIKGFLEQIYHKKIRREMRLEIENKSSNVETTQSSNNQF